MYLAMGRPEAAQGALERLTANYTESLEYPGPGGMLIVKLGRERLENMQNINAEVHSLASHTVNETAGDSNSLVRQILHEAVDFFGKSAALLMTMVLAKLMALRMKQAQNRPIHCLINRNWTSREVVTLFLAVWVIHSMIAAGEIAIRSARIEVTEDIIDISCRLVIAMLVVSIIMRGESWDEMMRVKRTKNLKEVFLLAVVIPGVTIAFLLAYVLLVILLKHGNSSFPVNGTMGYIGLEQKGTATLIAIHASVLAYAGAEEIMHRGILLDLFERMNGRVLAMIISSLLFAIGHNWSVLTLVSTFIFGLLACELRYFFGGLWPAIAVHYIANIVLLNMMSWSGGGIVR